MGKVLLLQTLHIALPVQNAASSLQGCIHGDPSKYKILDIRISPSQIDSGIKRKHVESARQVLSNLFERNENNLN